MSKIPLVNAILVDTSDNGVAGNNSIKSTPSTPSRINLSLINETVVNPNIQRRKGYGFPDNNYDHYVFTEPNSDGAINYLKKYNWPEGLINSFIKSCKKIPYRFIIVDNSGSMLNTDGHRLIHSANSSKMIGCSRWSELIESLKFHALLAENAIAPVEFRLLNNSDPILVGSGKDNGEGYKALLDIFEDGPSGSTPLVEQINQVIAKVKLMENELRVHGQKVCIVICSDGESTDGDLSEALRPLVELPVWVVVRLCTDESNIVNYWNNIDENLELDMDVLDDLTNEAQEIQHANPWLVYNENIHRFREWGSTLKELDLIDEMKLSSEQMRIVVANIVSDGNVTDWPHVELDFNDFIRIINTYQAKITVFDPLQMKRVHPINVYHLKAIYNTHQNSQVCNVM